MMMMMNRVNNKFCTYPLFEIPVDAKTRIKFKSG